MSTGPIILIIGTRPEGIKMAPVYHALKKAGYSVVTVCTMQHDRLLTDVLELFNIVPDYTLDVMRLGQDLFYLTQAVLQKTKKIFSDLAPSLVLVQGDTTSSMAAALAAFYLHIPVGHIEAGLRTDDLYAPFPEEMNRRVISVIAQYHFAPTQHALSQALSYGVNQDQIFCVGNTVVDALHIITQLIEHDPNRIRADIAAQVALSKQAGKKIVLLTMHRRESFGDPMVRVLHTVKRIAMENPDIIWIYPYHPNPQVLSALEQVCLQDIPNIVLLEPLSYLNMVYLLNASDLVLTDSGGVQEEAVSLLKPVLVLREKTERMEGVVAGLAHVVGTDPQRIQQTLSAVLFGNTCHAIDAAHTYGDGRAAQKIVALLDVLPLKSAEKKSEIMNQVIRHPERREQMMKQVAVIGLGYIGLPTAIVLAESGMAVIGVDINADRVARINEGDPDIYEPGIYEKLQLVRATGALYAHTAPVAADYIIIAVPTPITTDKKADLRAVFAAADSIAPLLRRGTVVILESTVSVGTTQRLADYLQDNSGLIVGRDIFVAHSPERVLPGKIFYELEHNDRIIGGITTECAVRARELYAHVVRGEIFLTDAATAELVKLVENSARDVEIAFAHQVASMAYAQGLDPYRVIELANKHPRVNILRPTCGVGGHCLAVDPWFLVETFPHQTQLVAAARAVNDAKPIEVIAAIDTAIAAWRLNNYGKDPVVSFLGLTYKANVDDLRESPACHIVEQFAARSSCSIMVCEPYVKSYHIPVFAQQYVTDLTRAISAADIVVLLVAHDQFKVIDSARLAGKTVIDYCGLLYRTRSGSQSFVPAVKTEGSIPELTTELAVSQMHKEDA